MLSYQVLKKRYEDIQNKNKALQKEVIKKEKHIKNLNNKIRTLKEELNKRNKIIQEKNIILGNLLIKK